MSYVGAVDPSRTAPEDPWTLVQRYRRAAARLGRARGEPATAALEAEVLGLRARLEGPPPASSPLAVPLRALADLPWHVASLRVEILICTVTFWLAAGFGAAATALDPLAAGWLLPPDVHETILAGLADGRHWLEPASVAGAPALSGSLLARNVEAAVEAMALGIAGGVGAILAMIRNGVFLGAVAGLVHLRGMDGIFWSFVAPHGLVELPAVWLAGGAGLGLGRAVILPGPRGRVEALREAGLHAGVIALALVPVLGVAALLEGFVSPLPRPPWASVLLALVPGGLLVAWLARVLVRPPPAHRSRRDR